MFENQKKRENMEIKEIFFYIKLCVKYYLEIEFTACKSELMPEEALTSFTVSNAVCGSGSY